MNFKDFVLAVSGVKYFEKRKKIKKIKELRQERDLWLEVRAKIESGASYMCLQVDAADTCIPCERKFQILSDISEEVGLTMESFVFDLFQFSTAEREDRAFAQYFKKLVKDFRLIYIDDQIRKLSEQIQDLKGSP